MGWFSFKKHLGSSDCTAVIPQADGLCIAAANVNNATQPTLSVCEFIPWNSDLAGDNLMQRKVRQYGLDKKPFSTILELGDYNVLGVEAPDVPANELRSAIRWQVKDLIDFHVDDAVLDVFDAPAAGANGQQQNLYVVVSRRAIVEQRIKPFHQINANITTIDIPELVLRNLTSHLPEDEGGVVFVYLAKEHGLLIITRQSTLYLARTLDFGSDDIASNSGVISDPAVANPEFDRLTLEIQRSLDYYDRYFVQPPISGIVVAPVEGGNGDLIPYLTANLGINSRWLDINDVVDHPTPIERDMQWRCIMAIGAALRHEKAAL